MLVAMAAFLGLHSLYTFGGGGGFGPLAYWASNTTLMLASLLAGFACLRTAIAEVDRRRRWAWTLFGAGALSWFLRAVCWAFPVLAGGHTAPFATPASLLYDGLPLCFLGASFYEVADGQVPRPGVRVGANLLLLVSGLSIIFILIDHRPRWALDADLLGIGQSVLHATALCVLAAALWLQADTAKRRPLALITGSLALHSAAEVIYGASRYAPGSSAAAALSLAWMLAFALQYWAAFEQRQIGGATPAGTIDPTRFRALEGLLPTLVVGAVVASALALRERLDVDTVAIVIPLASLLLVVVVLRRALVDRWEARAREALVRAHEELLTRNRELLVRLDDLEQAQMSLAEGEARFRTLADSVPVLLWMAEADGRCTWFNRAWLDFTGRSLEQEIACGWAEGIHPDDRERCLQSYAQAFSARVPFAIEYRLRSAAGDYRWLVDYGAPRRTQSGSFAGFVGCATDITDRKDAEARIRRLAYFDALTDLPNRALLLDRVKTALAHAARHELELALLYLDLDRIKTVNDTLGHAAGDTILRETGRRLGSALREGDTVARLGGDEFVALLPQVRDRADAAHVAEKLLGCLAHPFPVAGTGVTLTASIGIALYPRDGRDADTLLKHADMALYRAKAAGRNTYRSYPAEIDTRTH